MLTKTKAKPRELFTNIGNIRGFALCPCGSFLFLLELLIPKEHHVLLRKTQQITAQRLDADLTLHEKSGILGFPRLNTELLLGKIIPDLLFFLTFSFAIKNTGCRSSKHWNFDTFDIKQDFVQNTLETAHFEVNFSQFVNRILPV